MENRRLSGNRQTSRKDEMTDQPSDTLFTGNGGVSSGCLRLGSESADGISQEKFGITSASVGHSDKSPLLKHPNSDQRKKNTSALGHFSPSALARLLYDLRLTNEGIDFGTGLYISRHPGLTDDRCQGGLYRKDDTLLDNGREKQLPSANKGPNEGSVSGWDGTSYEVKLQSDIQEDGSSLEDTSPDSLSGIPAKIPDKQRRKRETFLKHHRIGRLLATETFIDNQMTDHIPKGIFSDICESERYNMFSNCRCHNLCHQLYSDSEVKDVFKKCKCGLDSSSEASKNLCCRSPLITASGVYKQNWRRTDKKITKSGNSPRDKFTCNGSLLCNRCVTGKQEACGNSIPNTITHVEKCFNGRFSSVMVDNTQKVDVDLQRHGPICNHLLTSDSRARCLLKRKAPPIFSVFSYEVTPPKRRRLS